MECLEHLLNVHPQGGKISLNQDVQIVCPYCRGICKFENEKLLSSLPKNLYLCQVIDLMYSKSPSNSPEINCDNISVECSFCKAKPNDSRACTSETGLVKCAVCSKSYCGVCFKQKHSIRNEGGGSAYSHHYLMTWMFRKDGELCLCCDDHKFVVKYYCDDCNEIGCIDCCLASHREHEIRTLVSAVYAVKEMLEPEVEAAKKKSEGIEKLKQTYEHKLSVLQALKQDAVQLEIKQRKEEILERASKVLDKAQEHLVSTWSKHRMFLIQTLSKEVEELKIAEASGTTMLDLAAHETLKYDLSLITGLKLDSFREELRNFSVPSAKTFSIESLAFDTPETNYDLESCDDHLKLALGDIRCEQQTERNGNYLLCAKFIAN